MPTTAICAGYHPQASSSYHTSPADSSYTYASTLSIYLCILLKLPLACLLALAAHEFKILNHGSHVAAGIECLSISHFGEVSHGLALLANDKCLERI